jgi:hypothetical protein
VSKDEPQAFSVGVKLFVRPMLRTSPSGAGLTLAVLLHRRDERTFIRSAQRYTLTEAV